MSKVSEQERALRLLALIRSRLERDLKWLTELSAQRQEVTMEELLAQLHKIYLHYVKLESAVTTQLLLIQLEEKEARDG